jgi:hypothetical protein
MSRVWSGTETLPRSGVYFLKHSTILSHITRKKGDSTRKDEAIKYGELSREDSEIDCISRLDIRLIFH